MAPRTIYEPPHLQLRRLAVEARGEGVSFEVFWHRAVRPEKDQRLIMASEASPPEGAVRWPTDPRDRKTWRSAILGSKDGWRRAYDRADAPPAERALSLLGEAFAVLDAAAASLAAREDAGHGIPRDPAILSAA